MTDDQWLSVQDLANRYGLGLDAVYGWNRDRKGPPYVKLNGARVFYLLADVRAWEKSQRVEPRKASR